MSRSRVRSSNKIQKWIRACQREGADGQGQYLECVYEKAGPGVSREEGNRILRAVRRKLKLPTYDPRTRRIR